MKRIIISLALVVLMSASIFAGQNQIQQSAWTTNTANNLPAVSQVVETNASGAVIDLSGVSKVYASPIGNGSGLSNLPATKLTGIAPLPVLNPNTNIFNGPIGNQAPPALFLGDSFTQGYLVGFGGPPQLWTAATGQPNINMGLNGATANGILTNATAHLTTNQWGMAACIEAGINDANQGAANWSNNVLVAEQAMVSSNVYWSGGLSNFIICSVVTATNQTNSSILGNSIASGNAYLSNYWAPQGKWFDLQGYGLKMDALLFPADSNYFNNGTWGPALRIASDTIGLNPNYMMDRLWVEGILTGYGGVNWQGMNQTATLGAIYARILENPPSLGINGTTNNAAAGNGNQMYAQTLNMGGTWFTAAGTAINQPSLSGSNGYIIVNGNGFFPASGSKLVYGLPGSQQAMQLNTTNLLSTGNNGSVQVSGTNGIVISYNGAPVVTLSTNGSVTAAAAIVANGGVVYPQASALAVFFTNILAVTSAVTNWQGQTSTNAHWQLCATNYAAGGYLFTTNGGLTTATTPY